MVGFCAPHFGEISCACRKLTFERLELRHLLSVDGVPTFSLTNDFTTTGESELDHSAIINRQVTSDLGVQQMPSVAANPLDPEHVLVTYMDYSLLDTGYAGIGVSVSSDGGTTWTHDSISLPEGFDEGASNPVVLFDDQGTAFLSLMAVDFKGENKPGVTNPNFSERLHLLRSNNGVFVYRSDDGGATWQNPVAVEAHRYDGEDVIGIDTPDMAIDSFPTLTDGSSNPNYGNIYVTWTRNYPAGQLPGFTDAPGGGDVMVSVSHDGGGTWETLLTEQHRWIDANTDGIRQDDEITTYIGSVIFDSENLPAPAGFTFVAQSHVAVGREGDVYVSNFGAGDFTIHVSTDGGKSFEEPNHNTGQRLAFGPGFVSLMDVDGLPNHAFRTHMLRAIAGDTTRPGQVYAVESIEVSDATGNEIDGADVFFARSIDFGETWETEFRVGQHPDLSSLADGIHVPLNDENHALSATGIGPDQVISSQAFPRITTDELGNVGVIWYDARRTISNDRMDVFGTFSTDGGKTFSPNFRISDTTFDLNDGVFTNALGAEEFYIGDWIGLTMTSGAAYAAWTDTRNLNQDVFVARMTVTPSPPAHNDRFEPNNTIASATQLGLVVQQSFPKLAVDSNDVDIFVLEAAATGDLIAKINFSDADAQSAITRLELWDEFGQTLLATGHNIVDDLNNNVVGKELRFPGNSGQRYQVQVFGPDEPVPDASEYALGLQSLTADLGTRAFFELNDSIAVGDSALYLVEAAAAGSITSKLTASQNVEGDLNLQLLNADTFEVLSAGEAPSRPFAAVKSSEPNDSIENAVPTGLLADGIEQLSVTIEGFSGDGDFAGTTGDFDFFSIQVGSNQKITVIVDPMDDPINGGLDPMIALYDSQGALLEVVDNASTLGKESLSYTSDSADTYFVAILHWESMRFDPETFDMVTDPFVAGTGGGVDGVGVFTNAPLGIGQYIATVSTTPVGPGAVKQTNEVSVQQGQQVLLLISGENGTSGDFSLELTNFDQFTATENTSLLFPAGGGPSSLDSADLNADGVVDVVVADALDDVVNVLLGNGDGTFQAPRQFSVGAFLPPNPGTDVTSNFPTYGRAVQIADLNKDQIPDLTVTNLASSDVSVLLGRGDGTFEPHRRFDATASPIDLDIGDLNNDGIDDITVITPSINGIFTFAVLLGRGDGTFKRQITRQVSSEGTNNAGGIQIADFNQDNRADLVIGGRSVATVVILLGNGDGTFDFGGEFAAGRLGFALAVDDIDSDGNLDIVNATLESGIVAVVLGNGDGTFQSPIEFPGGQFPVAMEIADFGSQQKMSDGSTRLGPVDGHPDLIFVAGGAEYGIESIGGPEVIVLPNITENGHFQGLGRPIPIVTGRVALDVGAVDLNNDNVLDIVLADQDGLLVVYGQPPQIARNVTPQTARDLGTIVHIVDQKQTIVPGRNNGYYTFIVPIEALSRSNQVVDVSLNFEHTEGSGIAAEVLDSRGNVVASGERFRFEAAQDDELLLHVFSLAGGAGAFTPVINILPQVVSIESQALLPGNDVKPGGPTTSIVVTLQGDRLDLQTAEDPTNYTVIYLGPDGVRGTNDDRQVAIGGDGFARPITYNPGANVEVSSGVTYPTAVRQTITLLFDVPLPEGSYMIVFDPRIQTNLFNEFESELLTNTDDFSGHPLVMIADDQISEGATILANDLVLDSVDLGNLELFEQGTPFLTQTQNDLGALLDSLLTELSDDPSVTKLILDQMLARIVPGLGPVGQRPTSMFVVFLDPVSIHLFASFTERAIYDLQTGEFTNLIPSTFVEVGSNFELLIVANAAGTYQLDIADIPARPRGGALLLSNNVSDVISLTDDIRSGVDSFTFSFETLRFDAPLVAAALIHQNPKVNMARMDAQNKRNANFKKRPHQMDQIEKAIDLILNGEELVLDGDAFEFDDSPIVFRGPSGGVSEFNLGQELAKRFGSNGFSVQGIDDSITMGNVQYDDGILKYDPNGQFNHRYPIGKVVVEVVKVDVRLKSGKLKSLRIHIHVMVGSTGDDSVQDSISNPSNPPKTAVRTFTDSERENRFADGQRGPNPEFSLPNP